MERPATTTTKTAATAAHDVRTVDREVWMACAGAAVRIPGVGSRVYYFPQGHAEQSASPPDISSSDAPPAVLCDVTAVLFLANPETDEVFTRIHLRPLLGAPPAESPPPPPTSCSGESTEGRAGSNDGIAAFAKVLTPSDANNAGAFSVPKFCADSIFPPLNFDDNPPTQIIKVHDVHGVVWKFRQIFRGAPRRHLLSTGWSKFVNAKNLIAGDAVVFIRRASGELFVGVRRTARSCIPRSDSPPWGAARARGADEVKIEDKPGEGFSRNTRGRVPPASVVEAVRASGRHLPFEVLYYPRTGSPVFVVPEEDVIAATAVQWDAGMRVRMLAETEDCTRMTWFSGTVSSVVMKDAGPWPRSPWRMLRVAWDEPKYLQTFRSVSPWQVELISATPHLHPPLPVMKKPRVPQDSGFIGDAQDFLHLQVTGLKSKNMDSLSPLLFSYQLFPAGMQGARHDSVCLPTLSRYIPMNNTSQILSDGLYDVKTPKKEDLCSELNVGPGHTSLNGASFPASHRSILEPGTENIQSVVSHPNRKVDGGSFLLFGQVIQIKQHTSTKRKNNAA